jgi:hypothetical protein
MQNDALTIKMNRKLYEIITKEGFDSNRSSAEVVRTILRNHYYRKYPDMNVEEV